jgi:DNA-binding response OmpR family regulator
MKKVVVVEDDPELRDLETFVLTAEGYESVGVADGGSVAGVVRREAPDAVLLDLILPDKHGNDVLAELAADPATATTPVIVVSGYLRQLRRTPQVASVLPKPFEIGDMLEEVASVVGRA